MTGRAARVLRLVVVLLLSLGGVFVQLQGVGPLAAYLLGAACLALCLLLLAAGDLQPEDRPRGRLP